MIELVTEPYGTAPSMEPADDATAARWEKQLVEALSSGEAEGTTGVWVAISLPGSGFWSRALGTTSKDGPGVSALSSRRSRPTSAASERCPDPSLGWTHE